MLEHVLLIEQDLFLQHPDSNKICRTSNQKVEKRFNESVKRCKNNPNGFLRVCVAFWTYKSISSITEVLKRPNSTICVDIHSPTDIEQLDTLVNSGVQSIFLFLYRNGATNQQQLPLLHSKIFLFNFGDGSAEIWMGSQNVTASALGGLNCESIHILKTRVDSCIYDEVNKYIDFIQQCCKDVQGQFDREKKEFYKKLQKTQIRDNNLDVLDVLGTQSNFDTEDHIVLIDLASNDKKEAEDIKLQHNIILRVLSSSSVKPPIRCSTVVKSSFIAPSEHLKVLGTLGENIPVAYIVRDNDTIPLLRKLENDIQDILSELEKVSNEICLIAIVEITAIDNKELSSKKQKVWKDLESGSGYCYVESLKSSSFSEKKLQIPEEQSTQYETDFDKLIKCEPNVIGEHIDELSKHYDSVLKSLKQGLTPESSKRKPNKILPKLDLVKQTQLLRKMHYITDQLGITFSSPNST